MENEDFTSDNIPATWKLRMEKEMQELFAPKSRNIVIRTGRGGMDLFTERLESWGGFERVYIGKKVMRILRRLKGSIHQSYAGRFYRLIKTNNENDLLNN